jgi:hypothetical protein
MGPLQRQFEQTGLAFLRGTIWTSITGRSFSRTTLTLWYTKDLMGCTMLSSVLIVIGGLSVGFVLQLEPARGRRSHNSILPRRLPPITSPERRESCPQRSASPTSYRPILEAARCGQLSGEKTRQIHPGTLTKYQSRTWKPPTHLAEEASFMRTRAIPKRAAR